MVNTDVSRTEGHFTLSVLMRYEVECGAIAVSTFPRKPVESSREFGTPTLVGAELAGEKHYSVPELAKLWGLSERTIRRMFENEPGVLCWGSSESRFKRGYKTLRVPETVMLRVHRQLRIAG